MNTKIILATVAVAIVATALVGVAAAQFANQSFLTSASNSQTAAPCVTGDYTGASRCVNSTTGEPCGYVNGTCVGTRCSGAGDGCQNGYCDGSQVQSQNRNQQGWGMMSQSGYAHGCRR
ncbi:MAG: hypothetical protein NWE93_14230 [Candidatus Bathyarchaeota archaeon]|nr:hypothetical protein [Candidatus Bathyarchaeota archaeon]